MIDKRDKVIAKAIIFMTLCGCLFFHVGCEKKSPSSESDSVFRDRLQAAKLITVSSEKNAALAKLVADAAKAGDGNIVIEAINEINQTEIRNTAASNAASLLVKAGKTKEAIKVAELINVTSIRNETLSKITTNE